MKNVYEVFQEFEKEETIDGRINLLRRNSSFGLKSVLQGTFHPNVKFIYTEDNFPKYKPSDSPPGLSYTSLSQEVGRAYLFERFNEKTSKDLTQERKNQLLIQIMESLEAKEAEVFKNMILKDQKIKGLEYDIVKMAFPDILPNT